MRTTTALLLFAAACSRAPRTIIPLTLAAYTQTEQTKEKKDSRKEQAAKKDSARKSDKEASMNPKAPAKEPLPSSIGQAVMLEDHTVVLYLRAEGPGGLKGDAKLSYPPNHKDYDMILRHVGGLKPGDSKPVPPFPD